MLPIANNQARSQSKQKTCRVRSPFTPARVTVLPLRSACAELSFRFTVRGHEAYASAFAGAFCDAACGLSHHRQSVRSASPCIPGETWRRTALG
ncbi:MAG: hypothetical protein ACK53Y_01085, partial [bacterium]